MAESPAGKGSQPGFRYSTLNLRLLLTRLIAVLVFQDLLAVGLAAGRLGALMGATATAHLRVLRRIPVRAALRRLRESELRCAENQCRRDRNSLKGRHQIPPWSDH